MDKWYWMMQWCFDYQLPPAQEWAWKQAEEAWNTRANEQQGGTE